MKSKINDAAAELFGPVVAREVFSQLPSRLLRIRWSSVDEGEQAIIAGIDHIGVVFRTALASALRSDAMEIKKAAANPAFNNIDFTNDEAYKLKQKTYRANSVHQIRIIHLKSSFP